MDEARGTRSLHVLLVEDETSLRKPLAKFLEREYGYTVVPAAHAQEARRLFSRAERPFDVALVDNLLAPSAKEEEKPEYLGITLLREIRNRWPETEVIIFTGWGMDWALEALQAGAYRYLKKPVNPDELGMTIRMAAEQARLRKERDLLSATLEISNAMVSAADPDTVLEVIIEAIPKLTGADACAVVRIDPLTGEIRHEPVVLLGDTSVIWTRHLRYRSLTRQIAETGKLFVVREVDNRAEELDESLYKSGVKSFIGVPISAEARNLGTLYAYSLRPNAFGLHEEKVLTLLAQQAGIALENARLFRAQVQQRREAETLRKAALTLTTSLNAQEIFDRILTELQEAVPYDTASVQLLKGKYLEIIGGRGFPNLPDILSISFPVDGDNPNQVVMQQRSTFVVSDAQAEYSGFSQEPHIQADIRGWLGVPMVVGDRLIGMIALDKHQPGFYTEEHARLAEAFAAQAAIAIENARLFQEAQEGLAYLRSLYQASGSIISLRDPDQVLQDIVEEACDAVKAWRANVVLIDKERRPQRLARVGFDIHFDVDTSIRPTGISVEVMRNDKPDLIEDVQAQSERVNPGMIAEGIGAAACFPLRLRRKSIGVMWVHYREPHCFSKAEVDALRLYANQAAIAYDNAWRMQELNHLHKTAEKLASVAGVPEVLQQIVRSAKEVPDAHSSAIWSYDQTRDKFILEELVAEGIPKDELERFREEELRPGRTAYAVMERGWVSVEDILQPDYEFLGEPTKKLLQRIGVRSFLGIALKVGEERLGVLYVNYRQPRSFGDEDKATLEAFAHEAALVLKKARLLQQVEQTKQAAQVVAGVTIQEDLQKTLDTIVQHVREVLQCDAVSLYSYNETKDRPGLWAIDIIDACAPDSASPPEKLSPESAVWTILKLEGLEHHCLAEDSAIDHPLFRGKFVRKESVKAAFGIQLRVGRQKVGVMFVNYRSPHRFSSDEIATIKLFANQAAVAIRNFQLYEEVIRRVNALEALYEAGKAMTGTLELNEILSRIVEQAWRLTEPPEEKAHFSHLALVDGNHLTFVIAHPRDMLTVLREKIDLENDVPIGVTGRVVLTGQSRLVENVLEAPDYIETAPYVHSQLSVPIQRGGQVIGVISVEHPDYNAFDEEDQRTLESLAAQAAIAIENARQYEELKRTKGLIGARTALAWMGMTSSAWRHAIDKHTLTIREQAQLLRGDLQSLLRPKDYTKVNERLGMIENLTTQILEKPIVPPLSAEEGVTLVVVNDLIGERARQLWQSEPYRSITLKLDLCLDKTATVRVSPEWLRRAFDVLVDNAVDAAADSDVREITVGTRKVDGGTEILVSDTGPGIPEEMLTKIGLELIERPEDAKGLGMGLLMAQTIAQTYGGDIWVNSTGPTGTTMLIRLPLER